ncbi:MAG: ATP synthase F1 subunit epsilon [Patescibacteria group bacterium]|nr:ATP synthase F1 subunit epsilon [Patescibacteria group bacterium]
MQFLLEIYTPERKAFSEQVDFVSVPTHQGRIGVLARHIPLFTSIVEGEVKIVVGNEEYFLAIGGGFMEVMKEKVIILVSRAMHAHELNEEEIRKAEEAAKEILSKAKEGQERADAQMILRRAILDLNVLRKRRNPPPSVH